MTRKFLAAGNWKMNGNNASNETLIQTLNAAQIDFSKVDVVVVPPTLYVSSVRKSLRKEIGVGAQNVLDKPCGAFTGESCTMMIKDVGAEWVIVGHSERRQYFGETDEIVGQKTQYAAKEGLNVLSCIGEKLEHRESGKTFAIVEAQMAAIAKHVSAENWPRVVIAYEPVWAIGTGKVATPEQAQEVHAFIRAWVEKHISPAVAASVRIVYGGSVNGENCAQLALKADIDGFLVGGASLKPEFVKICNARV